MSLVLQIQELLEDIDNDFIPSLSSTLNVEEYSKKIFDKATIFSTNKKSILIAFIAFYCNEESKSAYCTMIAVKKNEQNSGIGTNLIKSSINYLRKKKFDSLKLEIYKTNVKAIDFYKNLGFEIEDETDYSVFAKFHLK